MFKESLDLDYSADETQGNKQYHVYSIDDMTTKNPSFFGNVKGMCCNSHVMVQDEILMRTKEAYKTEATLEWERHATHINT